MWRFILRESPRIWTLSGPVATTKPLEGTIKAESVVIEAQIQTYETLKLSELTCPSDSPRYQVLRSDQD